MASTRERVRSARSLICLLQGLQGYDTTVELRREDTVFGTVENVDGFMNMQMSNCVHTLPNGEKQTFDMFFVHGKNIRFVHIPDEINIPKCINQQLEGFYNIRQQAGAKVSKRKYLSMKEQREKQKDILRRKIEETKRKLGMTEDREETQQHKTNSDSELKDNL